MAGAAALLPLNFGVRSANAFYQSSGIPLFKIPLRGVGPGGIPVALPGILPAPITGVTHYQMLIGQFQDQIIPTGYGFGRTTLWGYTPTRGLGGNIQPTHLGGIIVGQKGKPIQITFHNFLGVNKHILPVDTTIAGANQAVNRTAVHMHGGLVPWISDGGPFDWFDPYGGHGNSFLNNKVLNPLHLPGSAEYYYPLNQSARFMWYHDHAVGITRLNAYAGIASGLIIRDSFEAGLMGQGLPNYIEAGGNEIPLIFQDKTFVGPNIATADPAWSSLVQKAATKSGSLWYAHTYEPNMADGSGRWEQAPGGLPLPDPSVVPEFFGDTMLVNGTTFPEATVQARRYRLRLLNACNARFLNLQLYIDDGSPNGITLDTSGVPTNAPFVNAATGDHNWLQIGTEGGFLSKPVKIPSNVPFLVTDPAFLAGGPSLDPSQINKSLIVAPAERPDLIVDFSSVAPGTKVVLYSDAPSPFPSGDDRNDYFPGWNVGTGLFGIGNPVNGTTPPGFGPNTRVLMRFKVVAATSADPTMTINTTTNLVPGIDPTLLPSWGWTDDSALPFPKRFQTLNECFDEYGRLIQILGNAAEPFGSPLENTASYLNYGLPPSSLSTVKGATMENVTAGATEVWEIYNTTGDTHPMHFHLVNVQLINRQTFDPGTYPYGFTGPIIPPEPNELGWKETVPMYPGTVTRVIMKFDLPTIVNAKGKPVDLRFAGGGKLGTPPPSPRTGGNEYVWHCHILEHEEHDMMHAMVVT
jgi:spore coat protein A, manganese oxidase